jgi:oligopeptidase B
MLEPRARRLIRIVLCIAGAVAVTGALRAAEPAPAADKRPVERRLHGDVRVDEYAWLRDKDDPAVIAYLEAENAYAEAAMRHTAPLREKLYEEMLGRIKQTDLSVPYEHGPYWYYRRTVEGLGYPISCRKRGSLDAEEQIILDVNELAEGHEYLRVTSRDISPDHRMLAYAIDTSGYETVDICVKDLETGETRSSVVTGAAPGGLTWAADGKTLFYARTDESKRPNRIYRHTLGTDESEDVLVRREDDARFSIGVRRTRSDAYVLLGSSSSTTSEWTVVDAAAPTAPPRLIAPREQGVRYSVDHRRGPDGGSFYILTDREAPNYRLVTAPARGPGPDAWTTRIAHDPDVFLTGVSVFADHMVLSERRDGYLTLRIVRHDDGAEHLIELPESVAVVRPGRNPAYDATAIQFSYTSLVTPMSVFAYDLETRQRTLLKQTEVLGGYDPARYETGRLYATAPDGTKVPISFVHRKGVEPNGKNPCVLYGYGSYGASMDPWFSSNNVSLLDRGFVYAIAHVRGGSEMGRHWKEDGRMLNKRNTFTDFIACAEHLVDEGWTSPEHFAIRGGSAGGLLIGAVLNLRPDLFAAAHAAVPFVDVVNTMMDPSIPLTTGEYEEWGNPEEDEYYFYIKSYSPYDNVREQDYPDVLVTAGLNDPRVHYWEPAKWTARLRDRKTDDNLLVLRTNMGAGHGGASGRYGRLKELAWEYAFIVDRVGVASAEYE